jgi:hypothetical protein
MTMPMIATNALSALIINDYRLLLAFIYFRLNRISITRIDVIYDGINEYFAKLHFDDISPFISFKLFRLMPKIASSHFYYIAARRCHYNDYHDNIDIISFL